MRDKAQCPLCRTAVAPADLLEAPPEDDAAPEQPGAAAPPGVAPSAKVRLRSGGGRLHDLSKGDSLLVSEVVKVNQECGPALTI